MHGDTARVTRKNKKSNGAAAINVTVANKPLRQLTEEALDSYFETLNGHNPGEL